MHITVEPAESLVTEEVKTFGSGFTIHTKLTVTASVVSETEEFSFLSFVHIITDENGCFDMSTTSSLGGTYQGVEPMGLFWSMKKRAESKRDRFQISNSSNNLTYNFNVFDNFVNAFDADKKLCSTQIERLPIQNNISRTVVKIGRIHGILFCPLGSGRHPAVITIYGGTKKHKTVEDVAAILVNNGFVTLALAFFNVNGLPKTYKKVEIEYFEEAVDYLASLKIVNENAIGVYGISKGGGIALAMSHFLPQKIKAVVSVGGAYYNSGGTISYKGKVISEMQNFDIKKIQFTEIQTMLLGNCYKDIELYSSYRVPFENSKAAILFILGLDDKAFHTDSYLDHLNRYINDSGKKNCTVLTSAGLGHLLDIPFVPVTCSAMPATFEKGILIEYGGRDMKKHALAQVNVWKKIIEFFQQTLNVPKSSL